MTEDQKHVQTLIQKAANEATPHGAMQFAQAALNAAQALLSLSSVPTPRAN